MKASILFALVLFVSIGASMGVPAMDDMAIRQANATVPPSPEESPDMSPGASPEESPDEPICFPADAEVELDDGSRKRMEEVQLGDRVKVAPGKFSDVFMFTHKLADVMAKFVDIATESGAALSLTKGHYMYLNGVYAAAGTAKVGDKVQLADGSVDRVSSVEHSTRRGLFNPQTVHGDIMVNGIRSSTYTEAVEPRFAHAVLSPLRALYEGLGLSTSILDAGADVLAKMVPSGAKIVA